jgi:hypothetical protein
MSANVSRETFYYGRICEESAEFIIIQRREAVEKPKTAGE